ncbi:MAG: metallophosphoesterase [Pseudomonadales bacterium]
MKSTIRWILLSSALLLVAFSFAEGLTQIEAHTEEAATPWTGLIANDAPEDFSFVIVTDRTGGHRPGVFKSAMPKVNLLQPAFVVSVGDLIEGYTSDQASLDEQWDEFEGFVSRLDVPFFYTPGNHDMSNSVMSETWRTRFGPSYYHFVYKGVLFLVINSELFGMVGNPATPVPGPWQQAEQLRHIEHVLAHHEDARWTIVLTHQPLWDDGREDLVGDSAEPNIDPDWLQVEALLGDRNYTVFAGHYHRYKKSTRHNRSYITLATTGGSSGLRGPLYGEFDHVALVHMSADGPTIANLTLDGILPDDVATAKSQAAMAKMAQSVQVEPEFFDGSRFESGGVTFRITNGGDAPLKATASVMSNEVLRLASEPAPVMVAPGENTKLTLHLIANKAVAFEDMPPARVTWSLSSEVRQQPVVMEVETALLPQRRFDVNKVPRAVRVDADLSEWSLPYSVTRQGDITSPQADPADVSFSFGLGYDAQNLYFAADVIDDSIVASSDRTALEQDGIVIAVDARPDPERSANESLEAAVESGNLARLAVALITLVPERPAPIPDFLKDVRAAIPTAIRRTSTGYSVEMAVPVAMLNQRQGKDWEMIRVSIYVNDFDDGERGFTTLHWQPNRFGDAPLAGTGTFVRR